MAEEISYLLKTGHDTIVRNWADKVTADRRVHSDARLTYLQLVDHVPQIVEELRSALSAQTSSSQMLHEGKEHGRQRWQQGYELKEVVRELTLLRQTLTEFIDTYRGALPRQSAEQLAQSFHKINGFMDEELYKTIEAYLESPREVQASGSVGN
ncbi:MAG TPA: RsbRD N-terminal domain-containing protein [Pyrinomonadaceae bacterium]|jgi:hypothetical protein|nr:RsbRD N-terminal domain-containing protein [Pyrinomonadaceae bacterium]